MKCGGEVKNIKQALSRLEHENEAESFLFGLIWENKNMPIKLGVRAIASGGFQVNPAAVCLK